MTHHSITVAAPRHLDPSSRRPYLLQRDDDGFIPAVLAELADNSSRTKLLDSRARDRDTQQANTLKLYQPIQRRFHIALIEAWCDAPGRPRIDPTRVDAAGLVLRRIRADGTMEGWMKSNGVIRGWMPVNRLGFDQADPKPHVRLALKDTGVAQVDRALRALSAAHEASVLEEDVTPMFIAPPNVCTLTGQSLYYGVVSTASSERAQAEPDIAELFKGFGPESTAFRDHLIQPLKGVAWNFPSPPLSGRRFDASWLQALQESPSPSDEQRLLSLLRQVASEFDLFADTLASRALRDELSRVRLSYERQPHESVARTIDAVSFLRDAVRVLFEEGAGTVELPLQWPAIDHAARGRLFQLMSSSMLAQFKRVRGRPGRFDDSESRYRIRAFVRLKPEGSCPARTVWSEYSEPFVIAPWYEGGSDPIQIALPNLQTLKSIKPNVAFSVPQDVQNKLGNPKDMLDGKPGNNGLTIGWICSFSIPVITLCAFIVLNIFLSLFDIFLRWMLFIKICIPYPKAK
jgi:hypothetical protein